MQTIKGTGEFVVLLYDFPSNWMHDLSQSSKKLIRALSKVYNELINFISKQNSSIFVYSASNQVWYTIEKSLGKFGSLCFLLYTKRRQIFSI